MEARVDRNNNNNNNRLIGTKKLIFLRHKFVKFTKYTASKNPVLHCSLIQYNFIINYHLNYLFFFLN